MPMRKMWFEMLHRAQNTCLYYFLKYSKLALICWSFLFQVADFTRITRGGSYIGACSPVCDRGQGEVKRSRWNLNLVKLRIWGWFGAVKVSLSAQWAWWLVVGQGSRPDFRCSQGVKHENLVGQDLDPGRKRDYRHLCNCPPSCIMPPRCSWPLPGSFIFTCMASSDHALHESPMGVSFSRPAHVHYGTTLILQLC